MIYKNILIIISLILTTLLYSQDNPEYVIFTISDYQEAAEKIAKLHREDVEEHYRLRTSIVYLDEFNWYDISDNSLANSIREEVFNQNQNGEIEYLLLLGNEVSIPPIYIDTTSGSEPSDDFYSCIDDITELQNFIPQISTGRIPVNDANTAIVVANKLYEYMVNPTWGNWRSEIGLIADDENHPDGNLNAELNHTIYSNDIYENISNHLNVTQFYGINYESLENGTSIRKPQMTADILNYINQGVSLVNYIGHGSTAALADEKILDMDRDISDICSLGTLCQQEKKPAIWVVGTCSFGEYDINEEIMAEKLLFNEVGAIGLITTSRGIGPNPNNIYLSNLFNKIEGFILGNEGDDYRLGDIVKEAKQISELDHYLFHLLGDPALILPFPLTTTDLENNHFIVENENDTLKLEIMSDIYPTLQQFDINQNYSNINIALFSDELDIIDSYSDANITYTLKGDLIYKGVISENSCIKIPIDIETCDDCSSVDLIFFSDESSNHNGNIQIIKDIPVYLDDQFQNDDTGPEISLSQQGALIDDGSIINKEFQITITLEDEQGINFMDDFQHNVRYWFNDETYIYNLNSNLFQYDELVCGKTSADFSLPEDLEYGDNSINIEAWDNANNRTFQNYNFSLEDNSKTYVNNLYNFPNPFSDLTFFTFYLSKYPADIEINIYNINGEKIKTLKQNCTNYYNVIKWDGKTTHGENLSNGAYIYSFNSIATTNDGIYNYQTINKIAKLK